MTRTCPKTDRAIFMRGIVFGSFVRQFSRCLTNSNSVGICSRTLHLTPSTAHSVDQITPSEIFSSDIMTNNDEDRQLKRLLEEEQDPLTGDRSKRRRKKKDSPLSETFYVISMAAKRSDRATAMKAFRSARDAGLLLPQSLMNSVLYLLVGGERWYDAAVAVYQPNAEHTNTMKELEQYRDEVLTYMEERQQLKDEMVYIAQARLSACLGHPDAALAFAEDMVKNGHPVRLRAFIPALVGFAEKGERKNAKIIESIFDEAGVDMTELELRLLLKACTQSEDSYPDAASVLTRLGKERTFLESETIDIARSYFTSSHARGAFTEDRLKNKRLWLVDDVDVDEQGFNLTAGDTLSAIDLEDHDWDAFLKAAEALAISKERRNNFQSFIRWLQSHGPYPLVVDGANVAFHKQNYDQGAFCYDQVDCIMTTLEEQFPDRKALLILHVQRTKGPAAQSPRAQEILSNLQKKKQLFTSPFGSNDDWYWLYAALSAKGEGLLISNDECRDHIFQLLAPKYFLKWKERHLVRYDIQNGVPHFQLPSVYTSCTQQLSNGTWMLPYKDAEDKEKWLCAKPC